MRPLTAESASRPGVYVSVLIVTDPDVDARDIYSAISDAAQKARDRFRPVGPPPGPPNPPRPPHDRPYA